MTKDEFIMVIKLRFGKDVLRIDRFEINSGLCGGGINPPSKCEESTPDEKCLGV